MHSSGSIIRTWIESVRTHLNRPSSLKESDTDLVNNRFGNSMVSVLSRVSQMSDSQVVIRYAISLVDGQESYILPSSIAQVRRVAVIDANGYVTEDFIPRSEYGTRGPNWVLEGNTIMFRPFPSGAKDVDIWYVSNGDVNCHFSTGGSLDSTKLIATIPATPTVGGRDRRINAYAGLILRVINTSGVDEERIIESYDPSTREVTVRDAFTYTDEGTITYEIVPAYASSIIHAASFVAAMEIGTSLNATMKASMEKLYRVALKTAFDTFGNIQGRLPDHWDGRHKDHVYGYVQK